MSEADLPELPELDEMEPLEDLPDLPDLPDAEGGAGREGKDDVTLRAEMMAKRKEEKAPQHLNLASKILIAGAILPWLGTNIGGNWLISVGSKVALLLGAFLWHQATLGAWHEPVVGAFKGLVSKRLSSKPRSALVHFNALHIAAAVVILGIIGWTIADGRTVIVDGEPVALWKSLVTEHISLLLGTFTLSHGVAYLHGAKFNPLFPLMFIGVLVGGAFSVLGMVSKSNYAGALGAGLLAVAGAIAVWTIVEAMKQAKVEGDQKKLAALEARKAARKAARE